MNSPLRHEEVMSVRNLVSEGREGLPLSANTCMDLINIIEALESVTSLRALSEVVRNDVRRIAPHEMSCFCVGERAHEKGFEVKHLVSVDWPENSFEETMAEQDVSYLLKPSARVRSGIVASYLGTKLSVGEERVPEVLIQRGIRNLLVLSITGLHNSKSIYHCFANSRSGADTRFRRIVKILVPHINKAMLRLTERSCLPAHRGITDREMCVLRHLMLGYKNKKIADELNISIHTVKNHITSILGKLQVANRTQAVTRAMELRLSRAG